MKSIVCFQLDNSMPCFHPENVIFITNKWDTIVHDEDDSSDEDEETKTWNALKDNIKRRWPSVREELIFKMNLRDVIINQMICCLCICIFLVGYCKSIQLLKYQCLFVKVSPGKKNFSTEQFGEFKTVLEAMVTNAEKNRFMQHLRYILIIITRLCIPHLIFIFKYRFQGYQNIL